MLALLDDVLHSLRKVSWQPLQVADAGPNAALSASTLPAFAATATLLSSACILSAASLYLALSFQISGLARVSPLSLPSGKAAQGYLAMAAAMSAFSTAALAS